MVILEDTRNQVGKHANIKRQLVTLGHQLVRSKLYVGDYQLANSGETVIDTKKDMLELAMDLCRDHDRFRRECEKARDAGIKLIILTEEELPAGGLAAWKSPVWKAPGRGHRAGDPISKVKPATLYKQIHTMASRYGVDFRFCRRDETGRLIVDILTGGQKNAEPDH